MVAGIAVAQFPIARCVKDALMPSIVVLGARNLGGAILGHHLNNGWRGAAVARSPETLETVRAAGGLPLQADASDPESLRAALEQARAEFGRIDVIVNAVSPPRGRPRPARSAAARSARRRSRTSAAGPARSPSRPSSSSARACAPGAGTLIQVTGGSARRAMPGRGLWAAGAAATRALVHAAAQELRADGVHVALLIVDATIDSPKTAAMIAGKAGERDRRPGRDRARRRVPRGPEPSAPTRTNWSSPPRATAGLP